MAWRSPSPLTYGQKKFAADRANYRARMIEAGTYVSPEEATARTVDAFKEHLQKPRPGPTRKSLVKNGAHNLRSQLLELLVGFDDRYDNDLDAGSLATVKTAMDDLSASLRRLPAAQAERMMRDLMADKS